MKALILLLALVLTPAPCFAGSCSDTQNAATTAIKERNAKVKDTHNTHKFEYTQLIVKSRQAEILFFQHIVPTSTLLRRYGVRSSSFCAA